MYCSLTFTSFQADIQMRVIVTPSLPAKKMEIAMKMHDVRNWQASFIFFFFLPSVPDVIIKCNQIKVSLICVLQHLSASSQFPDAAQLTEAAGLLCVLAQLCESAGEKLGAGPIMVVSSGGVLKGRVSPARQSANILVNRGCLTGRCFLAPRTVFET